MTHKSEAGQCVMFLYLIDEEGREVFDTNTFAQADKDKIEPLFSKAVKHYFNLKKNITFECDFVTNSQIIIKEMSLFC